jgi:peptidoglycan L-alanyl-D-glutamate endopeptidase CwlK
MAYYSTNSINRLVTCHKKLWDLFHIVVETYDCSILCGWRGEADQNEAFDTGHSKLKWPFSMHNKVNKDGKPESWAVDACPYIEGQAIMEDREAIILFAGYVLGIANQMGIKVRWLGDSNGNHLIKDEKVSDLYHFELTI